jgi:hypothetical protein
MGLWKGAGTDARALLRGEAAFRRHLGECAESMGWPVKNRINLAMAPIGSDKIRFLPGESCFTANLPDKPRIRVSKRR